MQTLWAAAPRPSHEQPHRRISPRPRLHRLPHMVDPLDSLQPRRARRPRHAGLVLIVDDSAHTRELYTEYLIFRGLGVVSAPDAEAGLMLAHSLRPDVIVMDIAMPRLNGITATQRLKQDPRTRRIPVIVLTGYVFRAIEQGALEVGADTILTKPCLPEDLELTIRRLMTREP